MRAFIAWLERFGETSQDQYDFWATAWGRRAKALYYRSPRIGALAVAPLVFLDAFLPRTRGLVRPRQRFPIADAHYAIGFFALAEAEGDDRWVERGRSFLGHLKASRCPGFADWCWGYPFHWQTVFGLFEAGRPLITTMPYCYEAFEAGYELTGDPEYLEIMESAAAFAHDGIPVAEVAPGVEACSYTPFDRRRVVNASAYRAFLLIAAGHRFQRPAWVGAGERNLAFVLDSQREDGSWLYAMDGHDRFVDNFHTCFVLKNLVKAWRISGDPGVRAAIERGHGYWRHALLDESGQPRPFSKPPRLTLHRRDLYDYAEGINLALLLRDLIPDARAVLHALVDGLLQEWVLPDGHFVTRQLVLGRNEVPYHRWAQAQTFHALARCATPG